MARSVEGAARIRSTRGRSIISSCGTSCSGSSISGKDCSSGGVSSSGSINGSIEGTGGGSCGSGSSGGSCGDVEGGGRGGGNGVRRDDIISGGDGGGMEEIGRGKIAGDGSGSRVCTSRLLLTGWVSGAARHLQRGFPSSGSLSESSESSRPWAPSGGGLAGRTSSFFRSEG